MPTIGFVGRLDWWKGLPTLLEAHDQVRQRFPEVRLLVAGAGPEEHRVSRPGIIHLPFQQDLGSVWKEIDIAVVPSTQPDPFPRSVIEAMSWAKPVIGSAAGGIPEAIEDGKTGYLFPPGDAVALATRICSLLATPSRIDQMGRAARARCEQRFSASIQAVRVNAIYRELLDIPLLRAA
jgi:glycosyltransferase involved in cell wall biosynthesis